MFYRDTLHEWERSLGSPDGDGPLSFAAANRRDAHRTYAEDAVDLIGTLGAPGLHRPVDRGGAMHSLEQTIAASYAIGRRDASVSLAGGLQMWSHLVWIAGTEAQRRAVADVLARNGAIALAVSERDHGADVMAGTCRAHGGDAGYRLFGEKWPIGQASRCEAAFVLARTRSERGPRSLTFFYLDGDALAATRRLERVRTIGMRGSDLGGFSFEDALVPSSARIGAEGAGLELTMKLFQITRPLVASLALGPGDTMLRIAVEWALGRRLYGDAAAAIPTVRRDLVCAWIDLQIAEVVEIVCARGAHVHPEALSVTSLVAKAVAPTRIAAVADACTRVLGARRFLADFAGGTFDRMVRDQVIVPAFDGSTDVCLQGIAAQSSELLRAQAPPDDALSAAFTLADDVPPLDYARLSLSARGRDPIVGGLPRVAERAVPQLREAVRAAAGLVAAGVDRLRATAPGPEDRGTTKPWDRARRYAELHALASCAGFAASNRGLGLESERSAWIWMVSRRMVGEASLGPDEGTLVDTLFESLAARVKSGALLSVVVDREGTR